MSRPLRHPVRVRFRHDQRKLFFRTIASSGAAPVLRLPGGREFASACGNQAACGADAVRRARAAAAWIFAATPLPSHHAANGRTFHRTRGEERTPQRLEPAPVQRDRGGAGERARGAAEARAGGDDSIIPKACARRVAGVSSINSSYELVAPRVKASLI